MAVDKTSSLGSVLVHFKTALLHLWTPRPVAKAGPFLSDSDLCSAVGRAFTTSEMGNGRCQGPETACFPPAWSKWTKICRAEKKRERRKTRPSKPILVHIRTKILHSRTSFRHLRSCNSRSPQATICRRQRSLKEKISSGTGGFFRLFWISSGSSKRFMSWVTRARERPSLTAILALVIPESRSISWRHRQACWYGCMRVGL